MQNVVESKKDKINKLAEYLRVITNVVLTENENKDLYERSSLLAIKIIEKMNDLNNYNCTL